MPQVVIETSSYTNKINNNVAIKSNENNKEKRLLI